jgi:O-antigen/teichoic acid export membrane protein
LRKESLNSFWLGFNCLNKLLSGVLFFSIAARVISVEDFGTYTYIVSIYTLLASFTAFGLNQYIFIKISTGKYNCAELLKKSIRIQLFTALITLVVLLFLYLSYKNIVFYYLFFISLSLFFKPLELYKTLIDSNLNSKLYFKHDLIFSLLFILLKILVVIGFENPLIWLFCIYSLEIMVLGSIYYLLSSRFKETINEEKISKSYYDLIVETFPLLLAGSVFVIYSRIDQYMIYNMIGPSEQAYYTAALKLSEGWYFVFGALITSFFATISKHHSNNKLLYMETLKKLSLYCNLIAYAAIIVVTAYGDRLILLIYGEQYSESIPVLQITIMQSLIMSASFITFRILLLEGLQKLSLVRAIFGLICNIYLNFLMIPIYGISGAAIATLLSHFIALFLSNVIFLKTRYIFYYQVRSMLLLDFFMYKNLKPKT